MRRVFIPILSLLVCLTVIGVWTLGFSSFTIFSYTLKKAGDLPRVFPDIELINHEGKVFHPDEIDKYKLINFVYLNCPFVCHKVNNRLEQIYNKFDKALVPDKLEFLTVSFDVKNDDVKKIKNYRKLFKGDISGWSFALPYQSNEAAFTDFLHNLGIWKYTVPSNGLINHSIYIFLVNRQNQIVKVFDPARESDDVIIQGITQCLKEKS